MFFLFPLLFFIVGTTSKESFESKITKRLTAALISVLTTILTGIGSSILAYFLYKNTNAVAVKLMNVSAKAYNVTVGNLKNAYIWSFNVFCSSITCFSHRRCCTLNCYKQCHSCNGDNDEESSQLIELSPMIKSQHPPTTIQDFIEIVQKSNHIDFSEFLKLHQKYSQTMASMSHKTFCQNERCINNSHRVFEKAFGFCLEPFIYYLVFDWNELKNRSYDETTTEKYLFECLFRYKNVPLEEQLSKEWEYIIRERKKNVFITLLNFPKDVNNINPGSNEERLLVLVARFYWVFDIRVGNIVNKYD